MRCFKRDLVVPAVVLLASLAAKAQQRTDVGGRTPTKEEIQAWAISVGPEGKELPPGSGTAKEGGVLFKQMCAGCHGPTGAEPTPGMGGQARLVGGQGTLSTYLPVKTPGSLWPFATTIWDFIRRAMPEYQIVPDPDVSNIDAYSRITGKTMGPRLGPTGESLLSADQIYALTAFILFQNGIIKEDAVMNRETLPKVQMPNRNGVFRPAIPTPVWKPGVEWGTRIRPHISPNSKPLPPNSKPVNATP